MNQDGWELYDLTGPTTSHPEEEVQRRRYAAQDAERRALLPQREAQLVVAEASVRERWAAVGAVKARLADAQAAYDRRFKRVVEGRALRDPVYGLPIVPQDDERLQPELGRRRLLEQELELAQAEHGHAVAWCRWLVGEIAYITGTIPARA